MPAAREQLDVALRLRWVIFPDNAWIKRWDLLVLALLTCLAFILPYQVGVSGGYYLIVSPVWFAVNIIINTLFVLDTVLYFFRAYYDDRGLLVFSRHAVARHYLRTTFLPNIMSCLPTTIIFVSMVRSQRFANSNELIILRLLDTFKFTRFGRVSQIMNTSDLITDIRERFPSQLLQLTWFLFLLILVAHWFACIWCFLAFVQAGGFGDNLVERPNWIINFVNSTTTGINPIGWENDLDRYVLGLFWSIQTITSIGYGNISPYTALEWWFACLLMLLAGVMWAYVIGSTVSIAAAMQAESDTQRSRMDEARELVKRLPAHHSGTETAEESNVVLATRIRQFLRTKFNRGHRHRVAARGRLVDAFDIMAALPPELSQEASLALCRPALDQIGYLRSGCMSEEARRRIAMQCDLLTFAAGESFQTEACGEESNRGIMFLLLGTAIVQTTLGGSKLGERHSMVWCVGRPLGQDACLLETDHPSLPIAQRIVFLTFSETMFVSRDVVCAGLQQCPRAWKASARWRYLLAALRGHNIASHATPEQELPAIKAANQ